MTDSPWAKVAADAERVEDQRQSLVPVGDHLGFGRVVALEYEQLPPSLLVNLVGNG
jgi:hypothetical protein